MTSSRTLRVLAAGCLAFFLSRTEVQAAPSAPTSPAEPKFVGADKCKNCHRAKTKGDQFTAWKESKLAKAYETLASDKAKEVAKAKGVDDPQKSDKCLKCHVTAFGEPEDRLAKGFDLKQGVQCESCHGAGEAHVKARMAAQGDDETAKVDPAELAKEIKLPTVDTCKKCHNADNPTHQEFCMKELWTKAAHLDPNDKAAHERLASFKCDCPKCTKK